MKHADSFILILAVGTLNNIIAESMFVNADDDVGVLRRRARKHAKSVVRPRTLWQHVPIARP